MPKTHALIILKETNPRKMDDTTKCYQDLFEHTLHLLNDHSLPAELVAGSLMAIAQRLYKTALSEEEYETMMRIALEADVRPYDFKKIRLN